MGGFGSGKKRSVNAGTIENALRLDIRQLRRKAVISDGRRVATTWKWTRGGVEIKNIRIEADLTTSNRHILLFFSVNGAPRNQRIDIQGRVMHFGGTRFFFRCPDTGAACEILVFDGNHFTSRRSAKLVYASQSLSPIARKARTAAKLEARLFQPAKGKHAMRGEKLERLLARWHGLAEAADADLNKWLRES